MSIKVYTAFRLAEDIELWPFLARVQQAAREQAKARLTELGRMALDGSFDTTIAHLLAHHAQYVAAIEARQAAGEVFTSTRSIGLARSFYCADCPPRGSMHRFATPADVIRGDDPWDPESDELHPIDVERWIERSYRSQLGQRERSSWDLDLGLRVWRGCGRYLITLKEEHMSPFEGILLPLLKACEELEEYGYWNNADKPDELSGDAWNARADSWHEALDQPVLELDIVSPATYMWVAPNLAFADKMAVL
jgi:hypothetical protein